MESVALYKIDGYKNYYSNGNLNKADGVMIYIDESIEETTETVTIGEIKALKTLITVNSRKTYITSIYRTHEVSRAVFLVQLDRYLHSFKNGVGHCIIGDLNIDILNPDTLGAEYLNNLYEQKYTPLITTITRPNDMDGTCIDHIFGKNISKVKAIVFTQMITDHYQTFLVIDLSVKKREVKSNTNAFINYKKIVSVARRFNWDKLINKNASVNENTKNLVVQIQKIINLVTKTRNSKQLAKRKSWITRGLMISCEHKNKLYREWASDRNNDFLKGQYQTYNKVLQKLIKYAKTKYEQDYVKLQCKDSKSTWNYVNNRIGRTRSKENNIGKIIIENKVITDKKEIANKFNKYFNNVGSEMAQKIEVNYRDRRYENNEQNVNSIFLSLASEIEILTILKKLKVRAAGGIDGIPVRVLQTLDVYVAKPLADLINMIILTNEVPEHFKKAEIVPIFKANEKTIISNYRPISLISNLAKIFERVLHIRLIKFIGKNKLLHKNQFGFRKNLSTSDALQLFSDTIFQNLDASKPSMAIFLDLAKAFDTVDHKKLLQKLEKIGIRGVALNIIRSYLTNRKQVVKLDETFSDELIVQTGIPQGTILGPLLFIVFVNNLLGLNSDALIMSYADDTAIIVSGETWRGLEITANIVVNQVAKWLGQNSLSLNVDKTKYVLFSTYRDKLPAALKIVIHKWDCNLDCKCGMLERAESIRYLGIILDSNMNFKEHISHLNKKLRYLIFIFAQLKNILNTKTLMTIYYGLFESTAVYGIVSWGSAYGNVINTIQSIQNRIIKVIFRKSTAQLDQCFKENKMLKIKQIYYHKALTINNYKNLKLLYFQRANTNAVTRHRDIPVIQTKLEVGKKSTKWTAIKIFNLLDDELKNCNTFSKTFKEKIKTWICDNNVKIRIDI